MKLRMPEKRLHGIHFGVGDRGVVEPQHDLFGREFFEFLFDQRFQRGERFHHWKRSGRDAEVFPLASSQQ